MGSEATAQNLSTKELLLSYLITFTLALAFSSSFLLVPMTHTVSSGPDAISICVKIVAFIVPACFAYRYKHSIWILLCVFIPILVLSTAILWMPGPLPIIAPAVIKGLHSGLTVVVMASILSLLPARVIRQNIILGFALAAFIAAFTHMVFSSSYIECRTLLNALYAIALIAVVCFSGSQKTSFPASRTRVSRYGGPRRFLLIVFTQDAISSFMLVTATILTLIFGVFVGLAESVGIKFSVSDTLLLTVFLVVFILYLLSTVVTSDTWFYFVFSLIMICCVGALLAAMIMPPVSNTLLEFFGALAVIAMVPVCVFSISFAKEQGVSPVLIAGTLPMLISVMLDIGQWTQSALLLNVNTMGNDTAKIAALSLVVVFTTIVIVVLLISRKISGIRAGDLGRDRQVDEQETSSDETAVTRDGAQKESAPATTRTEQLISALMSARALTYREAEIAVLFAEGRSVSRISESMYIAESTVKTHLKHAYVKLGIHSRQDLKDAVEAISLEEA